MRIWSFGRDRRREFDRAHGAKSTVPYYVDSNDDHRVELVRHARVAGIDNLPESSADEPTDVEGAVVREHERRLRTLPIEPTAAGVSS